MQQFENSGIIQSIMKMLTSANNLNNPQILTQNDSPFITKSDQSIKVKLLLKKKF